MKNSEKILLNRLRGKSPVGDEEPLKNVKNEMGSVRNVVGNPMFKAEITLQISIHFYDNVGNEILPAALPVGMQTALPFFLFGLTDFNSGFLKSRVICPVNDGWLFVTAPPVPFVSTGILGYNAVTIWPAAAPFVQYGDLILQFYDSPAVNITGLIIVHCNNVAYGTFLNSFVSDLCVCNQIRYFVPAANIIQLANPLIFGYQSLFGKLATDTIDPRMYQTPDEFQNQIADIPVKFPIDKNLIIASQLDVFCQQISMTFFIEKVEPLTLRQKYR